MGGTHWVTMGVSVNIYDMHLIKKDGGVVNES